MPKIIILEYINKVLKKREKVFIIPCDGFKASFGLGFVKNEGTGHGENFIIEIVYENSNWKNDYVDQNFLRSFNYKNVREAFLNKDLEDNFNNGFIDTSMLDICEKNDYIEWLKHTKKGSEIYYYFLARLLYSCSSI
jgi:hypothetical protein